MITPLVAELAVEGLKAAFGLVSELLGVEAARAACDEACQLRKVRAEANAAADAKFGTRIQTGREVPAVRAPSPIPEAPETEPGGPRDIG